MDSSWDTIIVGAGIAGACAATYCTERGRTLVIEANAPASGASGAAAGLVNPFMGRRARPVWRREEALDALTETLARGNAEEFFHRTGVLRIPRSDSQAETYRQRHADYLEQTDWLSPAAAAERYPEVKASFGALFAHPGGFVRVPAAINRLLTTAQNGGAHLLTPATVTAWGEDRRGAFVTVDRCTRLYARRILLTVGAGFVRFPELRQLGLRGVKGQTVTVKKPSRLGSFPCISGYGYIAPVGERIILGSTYEHDYTDAQPSYQQTRVIIDKVSKMIPSIENAEVLDERAGIRVMTPHANKAMIGPLPGSENIWFYGGLGSKGLLMAPMMARRLLIWFDQPASIPEKLRPDSTRTTQ